MRNGIVAVQLAWVLYQQEKERSFSVWVFNLVARFFQLFHLFHFYAASVFASVYNGFKPMFDEVLKYGVSNAEFCVEPSTKETKTEFESIENKAFQSLP